MKFIQSQNKVICFGAANFDIKHKAAQEIIQKTSNVVTTSWCPGGVARNIAENLMRLGVSVILISRVGSDDKGKCLLKSMEEIGMDISGISISEVRPTGTYTGILTAKGEMFLGLADMEIYEELTPLVIRPLIARAKNACYWVLDANLPEATLKYIAKRASSSVKIWGVAVSVQKIKRFPALLSRLDGLILNVDELSKLSGNRVQALESIKKACLELLAKGVKNVVVTRGKSGVILASGDSILCFKALKKNPVDVIGAGDAFAAGILYGLQSGLETFQAVPYGLAAAGLSVEAAASVLPELSLKKLVEEMCRIPETSVEAI